MLSWLKNLGWKQQLLVALAGLFLVIVAVCTTALVRFDQVYGPKPRVWGVSFSVKYAQSLDLDWRQTYLYLLDELQVRQLRLMSYWDTIEPARGQTAFEDLDWQLQQARERGAKVSLAVGLRQPRWPECHLPAWARPLDRQQQAAALEAFVARVVERYRLDPTVVSWQLENEALNKFFGECAAAEPAQLQRELELVKRLDPGRPVIMNLSDEVGLPLHRPRPDRYGFSVYRRYYESDLTHRYQTYPLTPGFHRLRAALILLYSGRESLIHEMQAEPWGPRPTKDLSLQEQGETMDAARLKDALAYAQRIGLKEVYLWGAEWWYWRLVKHGDSSLIEAARPVFQDKP